MNINIIAPNGYKIYFTLPEETVEKWGNELITLSHFDVGRITFDFRPKGEFTSNISKTGTPPDREIIP